jgi:hypothetical protein
MASGATGAIVGAGVCAGTADARSDIAEVMETNVLKREMWVGMFNESSVGDAGFDRRVVDARKYVVGGESLMYQLEICPIALAAQTRDLRQNQLEIFEQSVQRWIAASL